MPKYMSAKSNLPEGPAVISVPCLTCGQPAGHRCIARNAEDRAGFAAQIHQNRLDLYTALRIWEERHQAANGKTCGNCAHYSDREPAIQPQAPWLGLFTPSSTVGLCNGTSKTRLTWQNEDGTTEEAAILLPTVTDATPACEQFLPHSGE